MGSRPVAGRPRFFGLAFIDICEYWFGLKASRGEAANFRKFGELCFSPDAAQGDADSEDSDPAELSEVSGIGDYDGLLKQVGSQDWQHGGQG